MGRDSRSLFDYGSANGISAGQLRAPKLEKTGTALTEGIQRVLGKLRETEVKREAVVSERKRQDQLIADKRIYDAQIYDKKRADNLDMKSRDYMADLLKNKQKSKLNMEESAFNNNLSIARDDNKAMLDQDRDKNKAALTDQNNDHLYNLKSNYEKVKFGFDKQLAEEKARLKNEGSSKAADVLSNLDLGIKWKVNPVTKDEAEALTNQGKDKIKQKRKDMNAKFFVEKIKPFINKNKELGDFVEKYNFDGSDYGDLQNRMKEDEEFMSKTKVRGSKEKKLFGLVLTAHLNEIRNKVTTKDINKFKVDPVDGKINLGATQENITRSEKGIQQSYLNGDLTQKEASEAIKAVRSLTGNYIKEITAISDEAKKVNQGKKENAVKSKSKTKQELLDGAESQYNLIFKENKDLPLRERTAKAIEAKNLYISMNK